MYLPNKANAQQNNAKRNLSCRRVNWHLSMLFGDLLQEVFAVFTKKRTWEVFKLSRKSKRSKETIRQIRQVKVDSEYWNASSNARTYMRYLWTPKVLIRQGRSHNSFRLMIKVWCAHTLAAIHCKLLSSFDLSQLFYVPPKNSLD